MQPDRTNRRWFSGGVLLRLPLAASAALALQLALVPATPSHAEFEEFCLFDPTVWATIDGKLVSVRGLFEAPIAMRTKVDLAATKRTMYTQSFRNPDGSYEVKVVGTVVARQNASFPVRLSLAVPRYQAKSAAAVTGISGTELTNWVHIPAQ